MVDSAGAAANCRCDLKHARLRFFRGARQRYDCQIAPPHPDLLRYQGRWDLPGATEAAVIPLPTHPAQRCHRLQRNLRAVEHAHAGCVCAVELCAAEPAVEIRTALRPERIHRTWEPQAVRTRKGYPSVDDREPAQATRKLGAFIPP